MKSNKLVIILGLFLISMILISCNEQTEDVIDDESTEDVTDNHDDQDNNADDNEEESEDTPTEVDGNDIDNNETEDNLEPQYFINQTNWLVQPLSDETDDQVVLITIDDVPDKNGLEMAYILKEHDVPAIFFVNGHFIQTEEKQDMLREIHEMGFAIGNHTYTHPNLSQISEEEQRKEIVELNDLIEEIIGERPEFFRAPHGVNTDYSKQVVEEEGMVLMNWTYGYDYFTPYMDKDKLAEAMITGEGPEAGVDYSLLRPGANLLLHDREWTKDALTDIVTGLRDKGYDFADPDLIQKISE